MLFEVEGNQVDVPDSVVFESLKSNDTYNAELDRIREKGESIGRESATTEFSQKFKDLETSYESRLQEAKNSGLSESERQLSELRTQMATLTESFNNSQNELKSEREGKAKSSAEAEIALALGSKVADDYDRKALTRDMMDAFSVSDGQFKLDSGAFGTAADIVGQFESLYPNKFLSEQPSGSGLKAGPAVGSSLLSRAISGDMAAKQEYVNKHGMDDYLQKSRAENMKNQKG